LCRAGIVPVIVRHHRQGVQAVSELFDKILDRPFIADLEALARMQRENVVAAARSWLGTPYHHAADVKGHGVDCAMILIRVYCDLGIVEKFDPRPYTRDWFMHRGEEKYLGHLFERSKEVREPGLGDIAVFQMGRCYGHAGIMSRMEPFSIIHAFAPAGRVVEDVVETSPELMDRMKKAKFASFWGGADGLPSP
jgi:hypothetical protein